jgi:hypothetical protein
MESEQSRTFLIVPEQDQLFVQYLNFNRSPAFGQFLGQGHGLPIPPQKLPAGSSRTDLGEQIVFFRRDHTWCIEYIFDIPTASLPS